MSVDYYYGKGWLHLCKNYGALKGQQKPILTFKGNQRL